MSTSESPLGECVVCGKESSTRCGQCSAHGTKYMFFCGPEHQRLVWFLHRKVCGPRSNPFTVPPLTEAEEEEFYELSRKRVTCASDPVGHSWQDTYEKEYDIPTPEGRDEMFKSHMEVFHMVTDISLPTAQAELIQFRAKAFLFRERLFDMQKEAAAASSTFKTQSESTMLEIRTILSKRTAIDYFSYCLMKEGIEKLFHPNPPSFRSELYHRFLLVCAVMVLSDGREGDQQLGRDQDTLAVQLRKFLEKEVKPIRPDIAKAFNLFVYPDPRFL
ncbi:hypothetical protein JCM5350_000725 [Sporobolomyces pararoseus]